MGLSLKDLKGRNLVAVALLVVLIVASGYSYFAFGTDKLVLEMTEHPRVGAGLEGLHPIRRVEIHRADVCKESGRCTAA